MGMDKKKIIKNHKHLKKARPPHVINISTYILYVYTTHIPEREQQECTTPKEYSHSRFH